MNGLTMNKVIIYCDLEQPGGLLPETLESLIFKWEGQLLKDGYKTVRKLTSDGLLLFIEKV